ncbi:insecticidal delta-endotoxin Cry8Ea1 family protein [Bacillus sp. A17A.1]
MNYTNRKNAKRKYKKAILATITTMTLGVSTFGGTASAFAAVKASDISQGLQPLTNALKIKVTNPEALAAGLAWTTGQATHFLEKSEMGGMINWNNAVKDLTIASIGLIPIGGAILSPILSLLWPTETSNDQMQKMLNEVSTMIEENIADYDLDTLKPKVDTLKDRIATFEKAINKRLAGLPTGGLLNIEQVNAQDAREINNKFKEVLNDCSKVKASTKEPYTGELPIYTTIATGHLLFLKFIKENTNNPVLQLDQKIIERDFQDDFDNATERYSKHIEDIYIKGDGKIVKKMKEIENKTAEAQSPDDKYANLQALFARLQTAKTLLSNLTAPGTQPGFGQQIRINELNSDIKMLEKDIPVYEKLIDKRQDYKDTTIDNEAFLLASGKTPSKTPSVKIADGSYKITSMGVT